MIEIRRLGAQIGAEINGVDVKTLDDATFTLIYRAWLDYNVVAVRGQDLNPTRCYTSRGSTRPRATR